jgi:hypothetical protein
MGCQFERAERRTSANDHASLRSSNLADVWCLLRRQANGEDGALQTNSVPTIFFVRDGTGELGVVDLVWGGAGWEIGASPVGDKRTRSRGRHGSFPADLQGLRWAASFRRGLLDKSLLGYPWRRRFDPSSSPSASKIGSL